MFTFAEGRKEDCLDLPALKRSGQSLHLLFSINTVKSDTEVLNLPPHAVFSSSADQSVLALYGKIVFFATFLFSFQVDPRDLLTYILGSSCFGLGILLIFFFFSDEFTKVKLTFFDLTGSVLPFSIGAINCFNLLENVFTEIFVFIMAPFRLR